MTNIDFRKQQRKCAFFSHFHSQSNRIMETVANSIDTLLTRVEDYGNTRIELTKLTAIDQGSSVLALLISHIMVVLTICIFTVLLSIGVAFWLGELLGTIYYGFLIVAAFYALAIMVLLFLLTSIKAGIKNTIIAHLYEPKP